MNLHSKLLGALFTTAAVLTLATASATHLRAEVRRVEELTKTEARVLAAQSEAANEKAVADMFRVLTGAEHMGVADKAKKKTWTGF